MGGMQYQTEHHLFPQIPFYNLPVAEPIIKAELAKLNKKVIYGPVLWCWKWFVSHIWSNFNLIEIAIKHNFCSQGEKWFAWGEGGVQRIHVISKWTYFYWLKRCNNMLFKRGWSKSRWETTMKASLWNSCNNNCTIRTSKSNNWVRLFLSYPSKIKGSNKKTTKWLQPLLKTKKWKTWRSKRSIKLSKIFSRNVEIWKKYHLLKTISKIKIQIIRILSSKTSRPINIWKEFEHKSSCWTRKTRKKIL